jgi:RibD C-terminal domain
MGKIRVHEFTTMDGVIDEPRWTFDFGFDPQMGAAIAEAMGGCDAILLGRVTYEMFEPAWSARTGEDDPGAPFMNDTTKYVVSSTLTNVTWRNSQIVGPYDPAAISRLKEGRMSFPREIRDQGIEQGPEPAGDLVLPRAEGTNLAQGQPDEILRRPGHDLRWPAPAG